MLVQFHCLWVLLALAAFFLLYLSNPFVYIHLLFTVLLCWLINLIWFDLSKFHNNPSRWSLWSLRVLSVSRITHERVNRCRPKKTWGALARSNLLEVINFCRAMLCKRGLCHHSVSVCVSVRHVREFCQNVLRVTILPGNGPDEDLCQFSLKLVHSFRSLQKIFAVG